MARIAAGDAAAFRRLADREIGRILRVAQSILGQAAEADEVAQEALLRIWRHAGRFDADRAQLGTWIHTIVARLCVDRLRLRRHAPIEAAMDIADPSPDALDVLERARDAARLRGAMARLPVNQRAALVLFYQEALDGGAAAKALGLSLRAFWSLLRRARGALRERMQHDMGGSGS